MARKPETTFINGVHRHLPASVYRMKNNNPYVAGVPDVWYSGSARDLWVEYKYLEKLPSRRINVDLSRHQLRWLLARAAEGRNVRIAVGVTAKYSVLVRPVEELTVDDFLDQACSRQELAEAIRAFTSD